MSSSVKSVMYLQVINQLACYIYVFLFFGIVIGAVVADLLGKVPN